MNIKIPHIVVNAPANQKSSVIPRLWVYLTRVVGVKKMPLPILQC